MIFVENADTRIDYMTGRSQMHLRWQANDERVSKAWQSKDRSPTKMR